MPLVYDDCGRLARHYLRQERAITLFQSTALVHEAYLRLAGQNPPQCRIARIFLESPPISCGRFWWSTRGGRSTAKRGGGAFRLALDDAIAVRSN